MTRKTTLIAAAGVIAALALYALAGFVGVPRLVRSQVTELFARDHDRVVTLGEVRFNPFTFEFEARELAIPDADGSTRMIGFERLYVDFELSSLWHRAWTFRQIDVDRPYLRVVQRAGGRLNLMDVVPDRDEVPEQEQEPGSIPALWIGELDVLEGSIDVVDQARAEPFATTLAPFTFALDEFRTSGSGNAFAFRAGSDRAGELSLEGEFGVEPLTSKGSLRLAGLQATAISEYVGDLLPVTLQGGVIDLGFTYDFSLTGEPYHLVLDMPNLSVRELVTVANGYDVPWQFAAIDLRDTRVDLAARSVLVTAVEVQGVTAPVWLDDAGFHAPGALGIGAAAAEVGSSPATPGSGATDTAGDSPAWTVSVPAISFRNLRVPLEDRRLARPSPLELVVNSADIGGFAVPSAGPLKLQATVTSGAGGQVSASGKVTLEPLTAALDLQLQELNLTPVQPYLDGGTDLLLESGALSTQGRVELSGTDPLELSFAGDLEVTDLRTRDRPLKEDFVTWKSLEVNGLRYTSEPSRLDIREVVAHRPYMRLILAESGVTNIESVLDPEAAAAKAAAIAAERAAGDKGRKGDDKPGDDGEPREDAAPPDQTGAPGAPALAIAIGNTRIVDGNINFADYTIVPNFRIAMEELTGFIKGSSSDPAARSTLQLDGQVDRYAPVHIAGQLNLLAPMAYIDIEAFFRNIDLTSFNPYSTKFIGYQIAKGKLFIDTRYKVEDNRLEATHKVRLDQLEFGEKIDSPDAIGLPIKLAVALLKDSKGVIDLELPVSGSVDDPQFRLGPIIWKAFVGLLTKIVTAPFALLGNLFGGGEDLSYIDFATGSTTLDTAALDKIAALRKAVAERPTLKLQIPWAALPAADGPALENASWAAAVSAADDGTPSEAWKTDRADYLRRLRALYEQANGRKPDLQKPPKPAEGEQKPDPIEFFIGQLEPGLRAGYAVGAAEIDALAQARAVAVRDALLGEDGVAAERVFVARGEAAAAAGDGVRMTLALE